MENKSIYSRIEKTKLTPQDAQRYVKELYEVFPGIFSFTTTSLFEEGDVCAHNFSREVKRTMNGVSSLDNGKQSWTPLLSKMNFDDTEMKLLTLGMRLASTPPDVHQGWVWDVPLSTTATDAWVEAGEVFEELWTQGTVMEEIGKVEDRHEKLTLPMSTPKTLRFIEEESNLKSALVNKRKEIGSTHAFFRPRSNFKPKKTWNFSHNGVQNIFPAATTHLNSTG